MRCFVDQLHCLNGFPANFFNHSFQLYLQVVTDIIHLQNQKLTTYKGNYDTFERTREEQIKNQQKAVEAHERSRAHMQVYFSL